MSSTVYILGAGASAASDFKLPVMKSFFDPFLSGGEYVSLHAYISKYFNSMSISDINVEELITHLEISLEKYKYSDVETHITCWKHLINYITDRLNIPKDGICKYHEMLYKKLTPNDSILTLNYDCIFEQSTRNTENPQNPYGYLGRSLRLLGYSPYKITHSEKLERDEYQLGLYVKLHGSVDWIYCPNAICMNHQSFQVYPSWDMGGHRREAGDPCDICGSPLQRVIVMPTMKKTFDNYPKLGFLWETALRKLKECNRLILIGTSLAISDYYLTWLIRETFFGKIEFNVEVVNSAKETAIRAKELTAVKEITWHRDFCEWVSGKSNGELI